MAEPECRAVVCEKKKGIKARLSSALSTVVLFIALLIIGILAIPTGIMVGLIWIIWSTADKVIVYLEKQ